MDYSIHDDGDKREIKLAGNLTFSDHTTIQKLIAGLGEDGRKNFVLSLNNLESIDSAGLGMLILLNDAAKEKGLPIRISSPQGQVKKMLQITEFSDVMSVEE